MSHHPNLDYEQQLFQLNYIRISVQLRSYPVLLDEIFLHSESKTKERNNKTKLNFFRFFFRLRDPIGLVSVGL